MESQASTGPLSGYVLSTVKKILIHPRIIIDEILALTSAFNHLDQYP